MNKKDLKDLSIALIDTFYFAGKKSIELRKQGLKKDIKSDNTPVTNGDMEVNNILTKKIKSLTPGIPIVSEESSLNKNNDSLKKFWLIDPIDGTYDYINNGDEFTLNAGLIINKIPVAGVINAPAKKRMFYSFGNNLSYELSNNEEKILNKKKLDKNNIKAVTYSNNLKPEILEIHNQLKVKEYIKMKSSIKFCVVASGEFQVYVADARANEWDIAAGHAILESAGGLVTDFNGKEIFYGKKDFKNPGIILRRSENL